MFVVFIFCHGVNGKYVKIILFYLFLDEERRVKDEKDQIQEIKDLLRDKTLRANELEVGNL